MPLSKLTRNSSGNTQLQSSQLAEPLWTNPGVKSGISVRKLISDEKKREKKKAQAGNERSNFLPKSSHAREDKATTMSNIYGSYIVMPFQSAYELKN